MHVTIKDPGTGEFVELCIPTYSTVAIVVRRSKEWLSVAGQVEVIARANGCLAVVDVSRVLTDGVEVELLT